MQQCPNCEASSNPTRQETSQPVTKTRKSFFPLFNNHWTPFWARLIQSMPTNPSYLKHVHVSHPFFYLVFRNGFLIFRFSGHNCAFRSHLSHVCYMHRPSQPPFRAVKYGVPRVFISASPLLFFLSILSFISFLSFLPFLLLLYYFSSFLIFPCLLLGQKDSGPSFFA
jgi:hypothetical protein